MLKTFWVRDFSLRKLLGLNVTTLSHSCSVMSAEVRQVRFGSFFAVLSNFLDGELPKNSWVKIISRPTK